MYQAAMLLLSIVASDTTYNYVQGSDKSLINKYLSNYNDKQNTSFNACLDALNGLNYYEAEKVLFGLMYAAKNKAKLS